MIDLRHNQEMAQAPLGIGTALQGHKGKLKDTWQEKGKSRKKKNFEVYFVKIYSVSESPTPVMAVL